MTSADLFTWSDEVEAAAQVRAAEEVRAAAERAARFAPHGKVQSRREQLKQATAEALRAEVQLNRIREGGH